MSTEQTRQLDNQEIAGFKIWYSDKTYSSNDGIWNDAPEDNVQVVMIYFKKRDALNRHTRLYSSGCDYYALNKDGRFTSHFEDISKVDGHVLYGKYMNWEELAKLEQKAFDDYGEDLITKSLNNLIN